MKWAGLFFLGFLIIFIGMVFIVIGGFQAAGQADVGMVVFIGPFPLVFSSGERPGLMALISLIIAALMILIFFLMLKGSRYQEGEHQGGVPVYGDLLRLPLYLSPRNGFPYQGAA